MSFIGIITNSKNEEYMLKKLSKYIPKENIIFITDKNIDNIKNIRFQTVLIDKLINKEELLKNIIANAKYILLNTDLNINLKLLENLNLIIITYGFNSRSTLTISSISENTIIICLQRIIKGILKQKYEPQEFKINRTETIDISAVLGTFSLMLIYGKLEQSII